MTKYPPVKSYQELLDSAESWADRAKEFIGKQSWSISEGDYKQVVRQTALYLMAIDNLITSKVQFPCYVVHSQDKDWRYVTGELKFAMKKFQDTQSGERVAVFYWTQDRRCKKLYESDGYALKKDYGMLVV